MPKNSKYQGTYKGVFHGLVAVAGVLPFFALTGAVGKLVRVRSVKVSGLTLTAVAYLSLAITKYSKPISAGTSTDMVKVPVDSASPASGVVLAKGYTAAPTGGVSLGDVASKRVLGQSTTAAAAGIPQELTFQFTEEEAPVLRVNRLEYFKTGGTVSTIVVGQPIAASVPQTGFITINGTAYQYTAWTGSTFTTTTDGSAQANGSSVFAFDTLEHIGLRYTSAPASAVTCNVEVEWTEENI